LGGLAKLKEITWFEDNEYSVYILEVWAKYGVARSIWVICWPHFGLDGIRYQVAR